MEAYVQTQPIQLMENAIILLFVIVFLQNLYLAFVKFQIK
ncbi:hypothetical protein C874_10125 [Elizabethkingia anophelis 502]|nr:hypothetical protein C874_10125 [Elizabethkingia anophelis 502]